jgi:hypothetical protein
MSNEHNEQRKEQAFEQMVEDNMKQGMTEDQAVAKAEHFVEKNKDFWIAGINFEDSFLALDKLKVVRK